MRKARWTKAHQDHRRFGVCRTDTVAPVIGPAQPGRNPNSDVRGQRHRTEVENLLSPLHSVARGSSRGSPGSRAVKILCKVTAGWPDTFDTTAPDQLTSPSNIPSACQIFCWLYQSTASSCATPGKALGGFSRLPPQPRAKARLLAHVLRHGSKGCPDTKRVITMPVF
jgi:hypothetical protein